MSSDGGEMSSEWVKCPMDKWKVESLLLYEFVDFFGSVVGVSRNFSNAVLCHRFLCLYVHSNKLKCCFVVVLSTAGTGH